MKNKLLAAIVLLFFARTVATIAPVQAATNQPAAIASANVPGNYDDYVLTNDVRNSDMGGDKDLGEVNDLPTLQSKYVAVGGINWTLRKVQRSYTLESRLALTLAQAHTRYQFTDREFFLVVATKIDQLIMSGQVADLPIADGQLMLYVSEGGRDPRHPGRMETIHRRFQYDATQPALMAMARGWEFWVEFRDVRVRFTIPKPCGNFVVLTGMLMTYAGRVTQIPSGPSLTNRKVERREITWSTEGHKSSWHLNSSGQMANGPPPNVFIPRSNTSINVEGSTASATGGMAAPMRGTVSVSTAGAVSSSTATGVVGGPGGGSAAGAGNSGASTGGSATVNFGN